MDNSQEIITNAEKASDFYTKYNEMAILVQNHLRNKFYQISADYLWFETINSSYLNLYILYNKVRIKAIINVLFVKYKLTFMVVFALFYIIFLNGLY